MCVQRRFTSIDVINLSLFEMSLTLFV